MEAIMLTSIPAQLTMDVVSGKCHVFENRHGKHKSIYCCDNAFEALNYIATENSSFDISDIASLWIDIESHEAVVNGMKQQPSLFGLCA
jgi:hypothetical protein